MIDYTQLEDTKTYVVTATIENWNTIDVNTLFSRVSNDGLMKIRHMQGSEIKSKIGEREGFAFYKDAIYTGGTTEGEIEEITDIVEIEEPTLTPLGELLMSENWNINGEMGAVEETYTASQIYQIIAEHIHLKGSQITLDGDTEVLGSFGVKSDGVNQDIVIDNGKLTAYEIADGVRSKALEISKRSVTGFAPNGKRTFSINSGVPIAAEIKDTSISLYNSEGNIAASISNDSVSKSITLFGDDGKIIAHLSANVFGLLTLKDPINGNEIVLNTMLGGSIKVGDLELQRNIVELGYFIGSNDNGLLIKDNGDVCLMKNGAVTKTL